MLFLGLLSVPEEPPAYDGMSDEKLLIQAGKGDKDAFHRLYENTYRTVYSYILSIAKNPADSEEILQDTYMRVWTSAASYEPQGKPMAWIFTIARNRCYMVFRSRRHEADVGLEELGEKELTDYCPQLENAADRDALNAALNLLSEEDRSIVLLHASSGMKHREIAQSMDMPLSTVLSRYNRAMKKLQKYLSGSGEETGGHRGEINGRKEG